MRTTPSQLVIKAITTHRQLANRLLPFIKNDYFTLYEDRLIFETVKKFIENYGTIPTLDALKISISKRRDISDEQLTAIEDRLTNIWSINPTNNFEWLTTEIENFCKQQALRNATIEAAAIISGEVNKPLESIPSILTEALSISFDTSTGSDLDRYEERFDLYAEDTDRIEFNLKPLNIITRGGLTRSSFNLFVAGTGVGKTLTMCSLAANNVLCARNVLYITGELSETQILKRIDSNLLNIDINTIEEMDKKIYIKKMEELYKNRLPGRLKVKEYPMGTTTVFQFHALLDELKLKENFVPHIIYVDYLGVFLSARNTLKGGMYEGGKYIAEDLKALAQKYKIAIVSAVQLNRSGWSSSSPDLDDTAESFAIVMPADLVVMMQRTEEMVEEGRIECIVRKTRYNNKNSLTRFHLGIDETKMRLFDVEQPLRKERKGKPKRGIPDIPDDVQKSSLRRFAT